MVDLGDCRGARKAMLGFRPSSGMRAATELVRCPELAESSRAAIGDLLIAASSAVRWVRAVDNGDGVLLLEVCLSARVSATEIDRALSALAVACEACAPEVMALEDPLVAERYLSVRRNERQDQGNAFHPSPSSSTNS